MSQSVIGALRVNLGLDSAQFERGLGSASKRLADMRGRFAAFSAAAGAVGVALGGLTVATARPDPPAGSPLPDEQPARYQ